MEPDQTSPDDDIVTGAVEDNPFAKYAAAPAEGDDANPFAKYAAGQQDTGDENPFAKYVRRNDEAPSPMGSALRRGLIEAPVGLAAGAAGIGAGSLAGMGAGLATANPIVGGAASIAAGVPAAMYVGGKAHDLEMWLLDKLGLRSGSGPFSEAQEIADHLQNPGSTWTGELAGNILPTMGVGAVPKMARAFSGALQGGMEAGQEAWNGEDLSAGKILGSAAAGAVFAKPHGWVPGGGHFKLQEPATQGSPEPQTPGSSPVAGLLEPPRTRTAGSDPGVFVGDPQNVPGSGVLSRPIERPGQGDLMNVEQPEPIQQGRPDVKEGEILPPETRTGIEESKDVTFAREQRDALAPDDPLWQFWDQHMNYAKEEQAMKGPPVDGEFSYTTSEDMARANDLTTTAIGVAAENHRAPDVRAAGNPVGAPMQARIAARPSEPARDYRKGAAPTTEAEAGGTTTGMHTPDVMAALAPERPEPAPVQSPAQAPEPPRQPRILPDLTQAPAPELSHAEDLAQRGFRATGDAAYLDRRKPVTAAVTEPPAALAKFPQVVAEIRRKLPPEQHAAAYAKAQELIPLHEKAEYDAGEGVRHTVQVGEKAVQTGGGKRADRKERAIQAWGKAYEAFGPQAQPLPENLSEAAPLARRVVELAKEANGGHDPLTYNKNKDTGYKPTVPPKEWKWLRAMTNFAKRPTAAYFKELQAEHALGGDSGERIDAEIASKKRPDLDKLQAADTSEPYHERVVHPQFDNSAGEESAVYKGQHDRLTDWLNNLSDEEYKTLSQQNDHALDRLLKTTQDPAETHEALSDMLVEAQRQNPPTLELASAEDSPVATKTPLKNAKDVAASEKPRRDWDRVLDKNSPEFKKSAAEALARLNKPKGMDIPARPKEPPAEPRKIRDLYDRFAPVDGSDRAYLEHAAKFLADEGGSIPLDKLLSRMAGWMHGSVKDYFTPRGDPAMHEYGKQIGMSGTKLNTDMTRIKMNGIATSRVATMPDGKVPLPEQMAKMYRAKEDFGIGSLAADLRGYFDKFAQSYIDRAGAAYDELRDISNRLKAPGWEAMPERKTNKGVPGAADWMPRRQLRNWFERTFEPIGGRGLSNWAESAQERDWFTLLNPKTQQRKVYRVNDDGNMVFYQDRVAGSARTPPTGFDPRDIGARMKQAGGHEWLVDHAKVDELEAHGMGEEKGKPVPLKFSKNPVYTAINSYIGLKSALTRMQLLDKYLNDPEFQGLSASTRKDAIAKFGEGNFTQTILPQLKDRYLPKPVAWAFDDMVKSGFHYGDNTFMDNLSSFTQATLKPFYFFGPQVHVLNELDKYLIGRGFDNLTKVPHFGEAIKSVRAQDAIQAEIMDAGGNPMWAHAAAARAMPQIAENVGEHLAAQPWKYDPLMKQFGVNTKEVLADWYQKSNKLMWWQSDVLYTALYLENKAKGMSPKDAVHETEKVIDSYVVPTTMGKTLGLEGTDAGRFLQQFMTDPIFSNFGRFHYGVYKMAANIVKNMAGPDSTMAQRTKGAGQALMLLAMAQVVYPALSAGYASITGNEHSEFEKRGLSRLIGTGADVAAGKKDPSDILSNVWRPSTVVDTVGSQIRNKDFRAKPILDASGGWGRVPGQEAEFVAGQMVSPYKTLSTAAQQGGPGWVGQRFLESNVGLKTPSEGAVKYEQNLPKTWKRNAISRERHPNGVIEGLVNTLVGR